MMMVHDLDTRLFVGEWSMSCPYNEVVKLRFNEITFSRAIYSFYKTLINY